MYFLILCAAIWRSLINDDDDDDDDFAVLHY